MFPYSSRLFSHHLFYTSILLCLLLFARCITREAPPVIPPAIPAPPLQKSPPPGPNISWSGTSWIILDKKTKNISVNYKGFHFASDGALLLINFPYFMGEQWSASRDNLKMTTRSSIITYSTNSTIAKPPDSANPSGSYSIAAAGNTKENLQDSGNPPPPPALIRLTSRTDSSRDSFLLKRVEPAVDLVENLWTIRTVSSPDGTFTPIQEKNELIILPDAKNSLYILFYNHSQRFRAPLELLPYSIKVSKFYALNGPNRNPREFILLNLLTDSNRYVQTGYDLFLYNGTRQKLALTSDLFN